MTPLEATRLMYGDNPFPESIKIAEYIKEHTSEDDRVAVIGSEPQIYFYADRESSTGYIYTYALMEPHELAPRMQEEMIREIESSAPAFLVFVNVYGSWLSRPDSGTRIFRWFDQYSAEYYDQKGVADIISPEYTVYVWGDDAEDYVPVSASSVGIYEKKWRVGEGSISSGPPTPDDIRGKALLLNKTGVAAAKMGNIERAIGIFEEAAGLDPEYAETYNNIGYVYYLTGDNEKAKEYFDKALEADPELEKARHNLEALSGNENNSAEQVRRGGGVRK